MTAPPKKNIRRRYLNTDVPTDPSYLPSIDTHYVHREHNTDSNSPPLRKSATFNSPTSPPCQDNDPIVNIPLLPRRSPTCPRALEDAVAAGEKRAAQFLGVVERSLSGLETFSTDSQETLRAEDLPVPRFMLDAHVAELDAMDVDQSPNYDPSSLRQQRIARKHHTSDSGIGSTITGSDESLSRDRAGMKSRLHSFSTTTAYIQEARKQLDYDRKTSLISRGVQSGINGSTVSNTGSETGIQHALSEYACRQIQKYIIAPIVRESSLKEFHPLVNGIPYRVGRKEITCLRDLEKVLLWLAPRWSVSRASFLKFCETSIQCIHTTVEYLNEPDQRRPNDRPYTNGYFLDLTEQVRQYAAMITAARERRAAGTASSDDYTVDERLSLQGGLSQTGRPAELVRVKNGKSISLRTGDEIDPDLNSSSQRFKRSVSMDSDDDIMRSMARRRKAQAAVKDVQRCSDCEKVFKRPCDLTKHEKTHSRPWKCSESNCKYHQYGWPTEKERDRHVNDKHSTTPSMYKCQYHPCPYESKRESNCKQHMEKAHGWAYVRSKNNGKTGKKPQSVKTPPTPQITTPGSNIFDASSPEFGEASSSYNAYEGYGATHSATGSVASEDSAPHSAIETTITGMDEIFGPWDPNFAWNEPYHGIPQGGPSEYTPSSHRLSWDAASMTNAPTIPSSFETSLTSHDQDPLFSENFDWSNMDTNFTSYNAQLITPACSVGTKPLDAFSRNSSVSLGQGSNGQMPSLSPGAHGNVMLYSPFSNGELSNDEGYDDFAPDNGKLANDFALFDGSCHHTPSISSTGNEHMFQDLATIVPSAWSGRGTELANQLGMNDLMQLDED